jgi:hypothetical protein
MNPAPATPSYARRRQHGKAETATNRLPDDIVNDDLRGESP